MSEYEYEVRFYGSQWIVNVLCYHEQDNEQGDDKIISWALGVADQNGLLIPDYDSVTVTKTGELL